MNRPVTTVAYYTLVEALRSGLPWLAAACVIAVLGLSAFLSQLAITEGIALQASVAGALLRVCAVFLVAMHVIASVARETNDKGLELVLALPIARPVYYIGKLLGFGCAGALVASLFALPLLAWAGPADLAAWWISLAAETVLVAAVAMFFATAMAQTLPAIAAAAGLYVLARAIPAIQAIAGGPLAADTAAGHAARWTVDALALLLPRLDAVARSDWLLYGAPAAGELAQALLGLAVYILLLGAAGLFDFARRNL